MTDDLGPLRQAMSDLAEHGGTTDLYEATLRRSRQRQRRAGVAAGGAAVAVVFAIGGGIALAGADRPGPPAPVATRPTGPAPATTPTSEPPPSSTPASSSPASSTPASSSPTSSRYPDCPSAKTLEGLADLPAGWSFAPAGVECWRTWATAEPQGPGRGDGIYLFQYTGGTGWRYHSRGSGYDCKELGITSGNPPFCQLD